MQFQLDFQIPKGDTTLKHGDSILLLGSCFSDNLAPKFERAGFKVCSNPLGTLFHPSAIATSIIDALEGNHAPKAVSSGEIWYDWRASSKVSGYTKEELAQNMAKAFAQLKEALTSAKVIVITFGTAFGYVHKSAGLVANCHKQPQSQFLTQWNGPESIYKEWEKVVDKIRAINPSVQFVFTVSPVRHVRDGIIENNRNKAPLLIACQELEDFGDYFPSYEIVTDVLRDYRFFKKDLVHPSDDAIDIVYEYAKEFFFSAETRALIKEIEAIHQMKAHRSLHPESEAAKEFVRKTEEKKQALAAEHPEVWWGRG